MSNKYQDALKYIYNGTDEIELQKSFDILQELVDKTKPMLIKDSKKDWEKVICYCPKCNSYINTIRQKYCDECGQLLDWRKF